VQLRRTPLVRVLAVVCLGTLRLFALAQPPAPQTPPLTFRSNVDLLTIETSVRDRRGAPVPDLQASDFTVAIDGRPRKVVSAQFFKSDTAAAARLTGGGPPTPRHVTNEEATPGRVVVFLVDGESIDNGQEKALFETASKMLDALSAADAVGLLELPGRTIDVTRDHTAVSEALKRFIGRRPPQLSTLTISFEEAQGIERGERRIIDTVVARECMDGSRSCGSPAERAAVEAGVKGEGKQILFTERVRGRQVLLTLTTLLQQMAVVRGPRSVILISGGLPIEPESLSYFKDLERAAAEARVMLYTVRLDQMNFDMAKSRPGANVAGDPAMGVGLASISSMTGGLFFTGSGRATGIFDRIASEVTSFYELGLESSPADADGKEHNVKVTVSRDALDVRAPLHVAVARPSRAAPRDALAVALQQPIDVPDIPLAITTYSTHAAGEVVRLLVSAEIGGPNGTAPAEWGLAVTQNGHRIVTTRGRIPAGSERPHVVSTSVDVPPGAYQLRVAAVDADQRAGVLEIPIMVGFEAAGRARLSDLVVGVAKGGELEPRRRIAQAEDVTAMLEVSGGMPADLKGTLQLIRSGTARSILNVPLSIRPAKAGGGPDVLQARAPLAAVAPGRYTASAALESGGVPLARISRIIEIIESPPALTQSDVVPSAAAVGDTALPPPPPAVVPAPEPIDASVRSPDEVMRHLGAYVERYGGQASLLVGVERYIQSVTFPAVALAPNNSPASPPRRASTSGIGQTVKRELVSEFVLVPNASASGGWLGYRDVIEVDGKPVADRSDRLEALFRSDAPDLKEARQIADEGARYNIGPVSRNFNVPTATLFFFHPGNLSRFTFRNKRSERIDDIDAVAVDFRETRRPTLIMNASGTDVPSSGTLWINPADGAVVRTRLALIGFRGPSGYASIDVTYRKDPALGMWVPSRMTERYSGGGAGRAETVATYTDFKRFQTSTRVTIPK
jgi:VWFA-related protein